MLFGYCLRSFCEKSYTLRKLRRGSTRANDIILFVVVVIKGYWTFRKCIQRPGFTHVSIHTALHITDDLIINHADMLPYVKHCTYTVLVTINYRL